MVGHRSTIQKTGDIMDLHNHNPLNINGAHSYILLYEIYETDTGNRVRLIAACRSYVTTQVNLRLEILTDIPQAVFIEQAHDYMQAFKARTVYEATLPQAVQFFCEKHITDATELLYDTINDKTPTGLYVDYAFSI